ncbi:MAG: sigma-54-dependent Fis family transcriptional regulator [Planctomycetes bacterium]|nr:sigma-54-dependent Fis family transcriptional regulator [Planctomycetota bacterium]
MGNSTGIRILAVDDEKLIRWSMSQALEKEGYEVEQAETAAQALAAVEREAPDLVLLDNVLPDRLGTEILPEIHEIAPDLPIIMITAHGSLPGAVEAVLEGAVDYLTKPFDISVVHQAVKRALQENRMRQVAVWQRGNLLKDIGKGRIIANSRAMSHVVDMVSKVAASGASTVLLQGESGVGKGLIARALHQGSTQAKEAFINISCTSLPDHLLESELFGHEKGAFTDANAQKKGLIEIADKGTVFLDEIGDLPAGLQSKLLSFLEERSFRRVGGLRDMQVNVRVIAATNSDLSKAVDEGRFRADLYYRLKVIPITIPPLRERREDIVDLAKTFIGHFNKEFGKGVAQLDKHAEAAMLAYPWPGNVRELRNTIERAVLLGDSSTLRLGDLPLEFKDPQPVESTTSGNSNFELPAGGVVLEDLEQDLVRQALERARGNRARAARLLGMSRDQMRYRIKKFDLTEWDDDEE